jgi:hypothetical protein
LILFKKNIFTGVFFFLIKAVCWSDGIKDKSIFVLVKGNLQGVNFKRSNVNTQISKNFFIKQFKSILVQLVDDQSFVSRINALSYSDAKKSCQII